MKLEDAVTKYEIGKQDGVIKELWEKVSAKHIEELTKFLDDKYIADTFSYIGVPEEAINALKITAGMVLKSDDTMYLYSALHLFVFETDYEINTIDIKWFYPKKDLGEYNVLFPLLVLFSGFDNVKEFYRQRQIPETILLDTLKDISIWLNQYHLENGAWGINVVPWLMFHFRNKIFRLGRLQYVHRVWSYKHCPLVYENKTNGKLTALCECGTKYRADGQADGTNGIFDNKSWTAVCDCTDEKITGNSINSEGAACSETVELSLSEWVKVLERGMPVLDIHIPRGEPINVNSVKESLKSAISFFSTYFPEKSFSAFVCYSWLLDPNLKKILSPESNIVQFQNEFHIYPIESDGRDIIKFIFGFSDDYVFDIKTAPQDTSLRRAVMKYMEEGNRFFNAAMFLLKKETIQ